MQQLPNLAKIEGLSRIIQSLLDRMTATTGRAPYFTTEFGCGLALISGLVALYFYSRRGELPQVAERKQRVQAVPV
jgi:hypothetical protein